METRETRLARALEQMADAAEMLWSVVANASGGDWSKQSPEWQAAAARWRDAYHHALTAYLDVRKELTLAAEAPAEPPTPEPDRPVERCVWREKYNELLYAVESKWPDESRHETALRYIRQAERRIGGPSTPLTVEAP